MWPPQGEEHWRAHAATDGVRPRRERTLWGRPPHRVGGGHTSSPSGGHPSLPTTCNAAGSATSKGQPARPAGPLSCLLAAFLTSATARCRSTGRCYPSRVAMPIRRSPCRASAALTVALPSAALGTQLPPAGPHQRGSTPACLARAHVVYRYAQTVLPFAAAAPPAARPRLPPPPPRFRPDGQGMSAAAVVRLWSGRAGTGGDRPPGLGGGVEWGGAQDQPGTVGEGGKLQRGPGEGGGAGAKELQQERVSPRPKLSGPPRPVARGGAAGRGGGAGGMRIKGAPPGAPPTTTARAARQSTLTPLLPPALPGQALPPVGSVVACGRPCHPTTPHHPPCPGPQPALLAAARPPGHPLPWPPPPYPLSLPPPSYPVADG